MAKKGVFLCLVWSVLSVLRSSKQKENHEL